MKCYKVLLSDDGENFYSVNDCYILEYQINKNTLPEFGKIFAFNHLSYAYNFISNIKGCIFDKNIYILKGKGRKSRLDINIMAINPGYAEFFWENLNEIILNHHYGDILKTIQIGTVFLNDFTPEKMIDGPIHM